MTNRTRNHGDLHMSEADVHDAIMGSIAWQEDHGACPTSVYRPAAREFECRFYARVREVVDADDTLAHHRMEGASMNSPMVYEVSTGGRSGYVVYVGLEHRNDTPLLQLRTFLNAWYFDSEDANAIETRTPLVENYFLMQDPVVLADLFMATVRSHILTKESSS